MSRYNSSGSYDHWITYNERWGDYRIGWTVDYYYPDSRLRYPRTFRRDTDEAGARRFCKRWNLEMPEPSAA